MEENKDLNKTLKEIYDSLTDEQKEKVKACKTADELMKLAASESIELPDEILSSAAGGGIFRANEYTCQGGCGRSYNGRVPFYVNGKPCCANCYAKIQQSQQTQPTRIPLF